MENYNNNIKVNSNEGSKKEAGRGEGEQRQRKSITENIMLQVNSSIKVIMKHIYENMSELIFSPVE